MSWIDKILPPRIKREEGAARKVVPEGLWTKCPGCEAVLYSAELQKTLHVCPKCGHHMRIGARARLDALLDAEGRYEIGQQVLPVDALKFKDTRKYPERLQQAMEETGETDALIVMGGSMRALPVVVACFEFDFMGGSMGSVVGERFVQGVQTAIEQKVPFICVTATGGARMQEGLAIAAPNGQDDRDAGAAGAGEAAVRFGADRPDDGWRVREFRFRRRRRDR
jgi:acetyl-CoA carboxylase carboxyl transferase subunit beta